MSNTPRTDAASFVPRGIYIGRIVEYDFSCKLETELADQKEAYHQMEMMANKLHAEIAAVTAERDALKKGISEGTRLDYVVKSYEGMASALIAERDTALAKLKQWESGELRLMCRHEHEALDFAKQTQGAIKERNEALAKLAKCREVLKWLEEVGIL